MRNAEDITGLLQAPGSEVRNAQPKRMRDKVEGFEFLAWNREMREKKKDW